MIRVLLARARLRGRLSCGRGVRLGRRVRLRVAPGAHLALGDGVRIGDDARVHVIRGEVVVGARAVIGERTVLVAHDRIEIGEDAVLSREVAVMDFDHGTAEVEAPVRVQPLLTAPVRIGAGATLAPGVAVQRGIAVGDGATVEARSVVTRDVAPGARAGGVPARQGFPAGGASSGNPMSSQS